MSTPSVAYTSPMAAAYLGTATIPDSADHRTYNEWHYLDHRPENLALDGVYWGERWVRTPRCVTNSLVATGEWAEFHYLNAYFFREPTGPSIAQWSQLAEDSLQWGRRPDLPITTRSFMSFFRPVLGMVSSGVELQAHVLPIRPNTGVYLTVSVSPPAQGAARTRSERAFAWYREVGFPGVLTRPQVMGVWAFASRHDLAPESWAAQEGSNAASMQEVRAHIYFLHGDPIEFAGSVDVHDLVAPSALPDTAEQLMFAGPLEALTNGSWNWFD